MSVEFDNDYRSERQSVLSDSTQETGIIGFLIKRGIVKSGMQARLVLSSIVIINIALTMLVVYYFII